LFWLIKVPEKFFGNEILISDCPYVNIAPLCPTLGPASLAGPLDPPPQPANGILNPEFSKIKKYHFVFHALKIFYLQKKTELHINNLIELKFNPVYTINIIIIIYRGKIAKHDSVNFCRLPRNSAIF
jgi:hypothetical protein